MVPVIPPEAKKTTCMTQEPKLSMAIGAAQSGRLDWTICRDDEGLNKDFGLLKTMVHSGKSCKRCYIVVLGDADRGGLREGKQKRRELGQKEIICNSRVPGLRQAISEAVRDCDRGTDEIVKNRNWRDQRGCC